VYTTDARSMVAQRSLETCRGKSNSILVEISVCQHPANCHRRFAATSVGPLQLFVARQDLLDSWNL
jgi:hypothetical protein